MNFTTFPVFGTLNVQNSNDAAWIRLAGDCVIDHLSQACTAAYHANMDLMAATGYTKREKGTLNETQYIAGLEQYIGCSDGAAEKRERDQKRKRCMYASGRASIKIALEHMVARRQELTAAIAATIESAKALTGDRVLAEIYMVDSLIAAKLIELIDEQIARGERELANDATDGRAGTALLEAYNEFGVPADQRHQELWNDDLKFVRGLDGTPAQVALQAAYDEAYELIHQVKFSLSSLKQNRGTLHEGQYTRRLEENAEKPEELRKLIERQRQLRTVHRGHMVAFERVVRPFLESAGRLHEAVVAIRGEVDQLEDSPLKQALIANAVAADAVVVDGRGRKMKEIGVELSADPTNGAARTALSEEFRLLDVRLADSASAA